MAEVESVFATSQDELSEMAYDILGCIVSKEEREKKQKEFKEFMEGLE